MGPLMQDYGDGIGVWIAAGIILVLILLLMVLNRLIPEIVR